MSRWRHLNGELTLNEKNIADVGRPSPSAPPVVVGGEPAPVIDGLSGEQRFFVGFTHVWRAKTTGEQSTTVVDHCQSRGVRHLVNTDARILRRLRRPARRWDVRDPVGASDLVVSLRPARRRVLPALERPDRDYAAGPFSTTGGGQGRRSSWGPDAWSTRRRHASPVALPVFKKYADDEGNRLWPCWPTTFLGIFPLAHRRVRRPAHHRRQQPRPGQSTRGAGSLPPEYQDQIINSYTHCPAVAPGNLDRTHRSAPGGYRKCVRAVCDGQPGLLRAVPIPVRFRPAYVRVICWLLIGIGWSSSRGASFLLSGQYPATRPPGGVRQRSRHLPGGRVDLVRGAEDPRSASHPAARSWWSGRSAGGLAFADPGAGRSDHRQIPQQLLPAVYGAMTTVVAFISVLFLASTPSCSPTRPRSSGPGAFGRAGVDINNLFPPTSAPTLPLADGRTYAVQRWQDLLRCHRP